MQHSPSMLSSPDLMWEICRTNNAFLVKRNKSGGIQLSRDPLNVMNKHSKKYSGFCHEKAIGISLDHQGRLQLASKNEVSAARKPATHTKIVSYGIHASGPKMYKGVAAASTKQNFRADLRQAAVGRASALKHSKKSLKATPERKRRGKKAS